MDNLLDRSDELQIELMELLEGTPPYPGVRHEVALVAEENPASIGLLGLSVRLSSMVADGAGCSNKRHQKCVIHHRVKAMLGDQHPLYPQAS